MIKHCVFLRFLPNVTPNERQALYESLEGLKTRIQGWQGFVAGANVTPETGMDKGFDGGFIINFADETSRDAYLQDPEHQRIGARLVAACKNGVDGIMVFDLKY